MAGVAKKLTPKQAADLLDRRREQQRLANAAAREIDRGKGLSLVQVKAPKDAAPLLRSVAEALRDGSYAALEKAADEIMKYRPQLREQDNLEF